MKRHRLSSPAAFSLVEIVLALGIIVVAFLSVVALLPTGLETLRVATNDTVEARITQEISGRLQESDWDQTNQLADFQSQLFHFDRQGNEMPSPTSDTIFTAQLDVAATGPTLPGADVASLSDSLREVRIKITNLPSTVSDRFTDTLKHRRVSMLATRMSR